MTTETGGCSPAQKKTATESEIRVRTGAVITLTGILVLYFSRYAYVLEAAGAAITDVTNGKANAEHYGHC